MHVRGRSVSQVGAAQPPLPCTTTTHTHSPALHCQPQPDQARAAPPPPAAPRPHLQQHAAVCVHVGPGVLDLACCQQDRWHHVVQLAYQLEHGVLGQVLQRKLTLQAGIGRKSGREMTGGGKAGQGRAGRQQVGSARAARVAGCWDRCCCALSSSAPTCVPWSLFPCSGVLCAGTRRGVVGCELTRHVAPPA